MVNKNKHKIIPVRKSSLPDFEDYIEEIRDLWEGKKISNMGEKHQLLTKRLESYLDISYISLYNSGHNALEAILTGYELEGEVITTPFTFISTTHAIIRSGLKPVFCDIKPDDFTIDPSKIEALITDKTCAILPVHVFGHMCDVEAIDKIAKAYDLKVIYDGAHVFGAEYKGRGIANYGDACMFSFHATKIFHTVEGGAVATNDPKLLQRLDAIKNFGITGKESIDYIGFNGKMNEFQAAMGLCNLNHVDQWAERNQQLVDMYKQKLEGCGKVRCMKKQKDFLNKATYFPIVVQGPHGERDRLYDKLEDNGIQGRKYFYPLTNKVGSVIKMYGDAHIPVAEDISERIISLPLYQSMTEEDVDEVCRIIRE